MARLHSEAVTVLLPANKVVFDSVNVDVPQLSSDWYRQQGGQ